MLIEGQNVLWVGKFDLTKKNSFLVSNNTFYIFFDLTDPVKDFFSQWADKDFKSLTSNLFLNQLEKQFGEISAANKSNFLKTFTQDSSVELVFTYSKGKNLLLGDLVFILNKGPFKFNFIEKDEINDYISSRSQKNISTPEKMSEPPEDLKALSSSRDDLESQFQSQSSDIKKFVDEQNMRLNSERRLVKLIKDLAELNDIDDLLLILRKELKGFNYLREPLLIYTLDGESVFFSQMRNSERHEWYQNIKLDWPEKFTVAKGADLANWVNVLNRPISKLVLLPFSLDLSQRFFPKAKALLIVEDLSLADQQALSHQFLLDRQQILSMSLDRILIEYQLTLFSYRWEKVFDHLKDPVAVIDANYNVLRSNQKFLNHPDMQSFKCYKVFANRDTPCVGCPMEIEPAVDASVNPERIEFNNKSYRLLRNRIQAPGDQQVLYFHRYYDETQHDQILKTLFQLEKMSSLGELSGHLAHELNNPLTGVMALAQVLQASKEISPQIKKDLNEIETGARRSLGIIKNLMNFTKADQGESLIESLESISLDECVERTLPFLKTALRQHRLFVDLKTKEYLVRLVPQIFQQVIFNLIQNAVQALSEQGTIKIWSEVDEKNQRVKLLVEDNGVGIPPENINRIFDAFYTTKKEGQGTGLGLSISKQIVETFAGYMSVESKPGVFTRFKIEFPYEGSLK